MSYETDIAYITMEQNIQQADEKIVEEAVRIGMEAMGGTPVDPTGEMAQQEMMQQEMMQQEMAQQEALTLEQSYDYQASGTSSKTGSINSESDNIALESIQQAEKKIEDTAKDTAKAVVIIT